jgi:hypothetical protein
MSFINDLCVATRAARSSTPATSMAADSWHTIKGDLMSHARRGRALATVDVGRYMIRFRPAGVSYAEVTEAVCRLAEAEGFSVQRTPEPLVISFSWRHMT